MPTFPTKLILAFALCLPLLGWAQHHHGGGNFGNNLHKASTATLISTLNERLSNQEPSQMEAVMMQTLCQQYNPQFPPPPVPQPPPVQTTPECRMQYNIVNGREFAAAYINGELIQSEKDFFWGFAIFEVWKQYVDQGLCIVKQPCIVKRENKNNPLNWAIHIGPVPVSSGFDNTKGPEEELQEFRSKGYCLKGAK